MEHPVPSRLLNLMQVPPLPLPRLLLLHLKRRSSQEEPARSVAARATHFPVCLPFRSLLHFPNLVHLLLHHPHVILIHLVNLNLDSPVTCYYANARSIRCKVPHVSFLLSSLAYRVMCFTETWLDSSDSDSFLIGGYPHYHAYRCDRNMSDNYGRGGGVACIVHDSLNPVFVSSFSSPLLESCIVDLNVVVHR